MPCRVYNAPKLCLSTISDLVRSDHFWKRGNFGKFDHGAWFHLELDSAWSHSGRFLTHPKTKKLFFSSIVVVLSQICKLR